MGMPEARRAKKEAAVFAAQLAALEQEYARAPLRFSKCSAVSSDSGPLVS
jgi:hypothetical protein